MAKNGNKGKFIQERKNGPWMIDTHVKIGGKYYHLKKRGFATKHEAQAAFDSLVEAKAETITMKAKKQSEISFEEFAEEFALYRRKKVCESTAGTNDFYLLKKFFHPVFDGKPVSSAFDPKTFAPWYDRLAGNKSISEARRNKAIRLAKAMLKLAYRRKYIAADAYQDCDTYCDSLKETHGRQKELVLWSDAQKAEFLGAIAHESADFVMFSLMMEAAPRIGEFLGLTADCFDYKNKQIKIKQQIEYRSNGEFNLTNRLKSAESYREIPLSDRMANRLQDYIMALGLKEGEYLFSAWGIHNKPISRTEFKRRLSRHCKAANVPEANAHAFRHMLETALILECESPSDVQIVAKIMGHSLAVSQKYYQHVHSEERGKNMMDRLSRKISEPSSREASL